MKRPLGKIAIGVLIVVTVVAGAAWKTGWLGPHAPDRPPKLIEVPPLPPVTRSSLIVTPVVIPLSVIQDAIEQAVPRDLSNQNGPNVPSSPSAAITGFNWSLTREPFAVMGSPEGLALSSALRGSIHAAGGFPGPSGGFPGAPPQGFPGRPPPGFFGAPPGFPGPFGGPPSRNTDTADQGVQFDGQIRLTARPNLRPELRLEPNLAVQVTIGDAQLKIMGKTLDLSDEMKPVVERMISEQVAVLQAQTADSPLLEQAVREQWAKLCRTIPLGSGPAGTPGLWLELRPTQILAAQPRIDETALTLAIGVRAATRIITAETKPDCPFPAQLEIVPQMDQGQINIDLPIDIPFTEVDRLIESQLTGRTFPLDNSGAFTATFRSAKLAASGDRLLISLGIRANETKTWLRLGADATIHVWGRPVLDRARQQLHFDHIELDVESEAAFGALGFAAQAAVPYLQKTLADHSEIDLSPLVANAYKNIESAVANFRKDAAGAQLDAKVVDVRLADIEFDVKTLRIIATAEGTVRVTVSKLGDR